MAARAEDKFQTLFETGEGTKFPGRVRPRSDVVVHQTNVVTSSDRTQPTEAVLVCDNGSGWSRAVVAEGCGRAEPAAVFEDARTVRDHFASNPTYSTQDKKEWTRLVREAAEEHRHKLTYGASVAVADVSSGAVCVVRVRQYGSPGAFVCTPRGKLLFATDYVNHMFDIDKNGICEISPVGDLFVGGNMDPEFSKHARCDQWVVDGPAFLVVASDGLLEMLRRPNSARMDPTRVRTAVTAANVSGILPQTDEPVTLSSLSDNLVAAARAFASQRVEESDAPAGDDLTMVVFKLPFDASSFSCSLQ